MTSHIFLIHFLDLPYTCHGFIFLSSYNVITKSLNPSSVYVTSLMFNHLENITFYGSYSVLCY